VIHYIAAAVALVFVLSPVFYLVMSSLKPITELITPEVSVLPRHPSLAGYVDFLTNAERLGYIANSLVVALAVTVLTVGVSAFGGYSLARLPFWGRNALGRLVLFTYIVPKVLLMLPVFVMMAQIGLINTRVAVVLAHMTFALPFCLWMLRGFFAGIPRELEEAAMVDGTTRVGALFRVVMPLARPGLVAVAAYTFVLSWNEFMFAFVLIDRSYMRTLPLGLAQMFSTSISTGPEWTLLLAGSVIAITPVLVLFLLLQRFLVQGLTAGAVKG
jgi:ABC-type glycerol-3-phosphate transport system permease component